MTSSPPTEQEEGGGRSETTDEAQTETKDTLMKLLSFVFSASVSARRRCHATEQRADGAPGDNQPSVTLATAHCTEHEGEEWVDTRLSAAHTYTHTLSASFLFLFHSLLSFHSPLPTSIHFLHFFIHSSPPVSFQRKTSHTCARTHTQIQTPHTHTHTHRSKHTQTHIRTAVSPLSGLCVTSNSLT